MLMTHAHDWAYRLVWLLFIFAGCAWSELNNVTSPTHFFRSRPDIHAPIIDMRILRPELLEPGYIFLAPYRSVAAGPHIYDNFGELVWAGAGSAGPRTAHMPHVCQYKGEDHLCYFQGDQHHGFARGFGVIMDRSYRIVKTVESAGAGSSADMHEFRLTPFSNGKTALVTVYQTKAYDLTVNPRFNLRNGMGWIIDSVFQEIDVESGQLLFEWRSLDHVDPAASWIMPDTTDTSGNGLDNFNAWDYFHINSVDKNKDGDYLISARHTGAIYKLSGKDGRILWQLGGVAPTIECTGFAFGYQHEVRWISETRTNTVLSFFDNAGNSYNHTSKWSRGVVVSIDHSSNTAELLKSWGAPEPRGGLRSGSQGNMQLLPGGGCHMAWGEHAYISEHTADGNAVMYGRIASRESNVMIYRSYKFPWIGYPKTNPALWTFSKSGDDTSGTRLFVSWNGATEVVFWRFFSAPSAAGPFSRAALTARAGFETEHLLPAFAQWTYAEALDAQGRPLGQTPVTRTFVPSPGLATFCDERGCTNNEAVPRNNSVPYSAVFETAPEFLSTNSGFDTTQYYIDSRVQSAAGSESLVTHPFRTGAWLLICITMLMLCLWAMRRGRTGTTAGRLLDTLSMLYQSLLALCLRSTNGRRMEHEKDEWELMSTSSSRGS